MNNIKEGQIIETNRGIALLLRQDEDMPNLWHLLIGKDRSFVFDTNKNKAISRASAMMEHYEIERQQTDKMIKVKMKEIEDRMENSIVKKLVENDTIVKSERDK